MSGRAALAALGLILALLPGVRAADYPATGVRAIDGDSINVRMPSGLLVEVRLVSIDAPEHDQSLGAEARAFTDSRVRERSLRLRTGPKERDRYGRLLATVELDGDASTSLNGALVEAGLAVVWVIPPNVDGTDALLAAQHAAWKAHRGIWGPEGPSLDPRSHRAVEGGAAEAGRPLRHRNFVVVGNRRSHVAHWPGCLHVETMSPRNVRRFPDVAHAVAAGYRMEAGSR